jgi:hypothetical protein
MSPDRYCEFAKKNDRVTQERERRKRNRRRGSACRKARMIVMLRPPSCTGQPLLVRSRSCVHLGHRVWAARAFAIPDTIRFPSKCPRARPDRTGSSDSPGAPSRYHAGVRTMPVGRPSSPRRVSFRLSRCGPDAARRDELGRYGVERAHCPATRRCVVRSPRHHPSYPERQWRRLSSDAPSRTMRSMP